MILYNNQDCIEYSYKYVVYKANLLHIRVKILWYLWSITLCQSARPQIYT